MEITKEGPLNVKMGTERDGNTVDNPWHVCRSEKGTAENQGKWEVMHVLVECQR